MRFMRFWFLMAVFPPVCIVAQTIAPIPQNNSAEDLWLIRSQAITDDLVKDAGDLSSTERAILWAKLAQSWWRINPEKARSWMHKAIEIVEEVPNRENADERSKRLSAARSILPVITALDPDLSKQLIAFLGGDNNNVGHESDADGLIEAAIAIVDKDPYRAAELGSTALRVGRPTQIASLLFPLRQRSPNLADALFAEALEVGRQDLDSRLLSSLAFAAFPAERQVGANVPVPADELRRQLLELDIAFLQANQTNSENPNILCASISAFIAPVLPQFDRLLPMHATMARQSVSRCLSASPLMRQQMDESLGAKPTKTLEDLLKVADESQDLKVRILYRYRAAELAHKNKEYARALTILDSIDSEGRKLMGGSWEAYRWQWADDLALEYFSQGDASKMHEVINATPEDMQPFAKIAFVGRLPEKRDQAIDPTLEFLSEARKGLDKSAVPDSEKCTWYLGLLRLTVKYQPTDATAVLKETVDALNHASEKEATELHGDARSAFLQSISRNFPASLMEMEEYAVKDAIAHIDSTDVRAQVRLDLLSACLARLRNLKQANKQSISKGE
jgi:hypothetical protein